VADPTLADIIVRNAAATDVGSRADGVLGSTEFMYNPNASGTVAGGLPFHRFIGQADVALITGWNWYVSAGTTVPAGQYDYESVVLHELARAVGINYSSGPQSVGLDSLKMGETRRQLSETDVVQLALRYTPPAVGNPASSPTPDAAPADGSPFHGAAENTAAPAPAAAGALNHHSGAAVVTPTLSRESLALLVAPGEDHAVVLVTPGTPTETGNSGSAPATPLLPAPTHVDGRDAYWLSSGAASAGSLDVLQESDVTGPHPLVETALGGTISAPASSGGRHEVPHLVSPELSDLVFGETTVPSHEEAPWLSLSQHVSPLLAGVFAAGFVAVHPRRKGEEDRPSRRRRNLA
jgi:hypothetical protein